MCIGRPDQNKLSFLKIPFGTDKESLGLRQKWVNTIRQENLSEKQIDNARICSTISLLVSVAR